MILMFELSPKTKFLNFFRNLGRVRPVEQLLCKFSQGHGYKSLIAKIIPNHYQYPIDSIRKAEREGINYQLDISDYVDHNIYFGLTTEENPLIYESINDGDIVIDVGTNIGHVLMKMAKVNPSGRIFGFEPHPINFQKAVNNLSLNSFKNVEINNIAVSDELGELSFFNERSRNMGGVSLNKSYKGPGRISAITLDKFLHENNIEEVDFIKIDVEGFEFKVIKGARMIIEKCHPKLFIEINDSFLKTNNDSAKSVISNLVSHGYQIQRADNLETVDAVYNFTDKHFDILCTHRDKSNSHVY